MTTLAFGAYALALLAALLLTGSLSDHLGRRPVIAGAVVIQLAAMLVFVFAPNIDWVIAARVLQGVSTGVITGPFAAAIIELAPVRRTRLAEIIVAVAGAGALGVGALLAGVAIELTPDAVTVVFWTLTVVMALGTVVIMLLPETAQKPPASARVDLRPRVGVSLPARSEYRAAVPAIIGLWMHGGLFLGLAPMIVRDIFGYDSGLIQGATTFVSPAMTAIAGLLVGRFNARTALVGGIAAIGVGATTIGAAILSQQFGLLLLGGAIGGAGFGAGFSAVMRIINPLTDTSQRAATFAAIYVVAYLSFGVPSIIAGTFIAEVGIGKVATGYAALTALTALIGFTIQMGRVRARRHTNEWRAVLAQ
jgi:MFS family permease